MSLSEPFIKRPVMTWILMGAILLMGILAFRKLPVTDMPNVDFPVVSVQAMYSGASPDVMARTVTTPLEKELINITGIKQLTSQSSRGFSWIHLIFELDRNIDDAVQDIQAALKKAEGSLPPDLDQAPIYYKANAHNESIIYLILTSPSSSLSELYDYAHSRIEQRIARIEGVGKVEVYGSPYAVRIQLNPERLAARGLSFEEVRAAVAEAIGNPPLGVLDTPGRKFTLEVPSKYASALDFGNLLITPEIRLKEVAHVFDGLESDDVFHFLTRKSDQFAVIIPVQKQNGANAVKISETLQKILPEMRAELPASMHLQLWFDKANWIKEAIEDVEWSLILSFALVVGVIFFTLGRIRETLIAAAALPLSIIGTFIIMYFLNFNIDILSLLALTLAMGFVIDDAIVVLENIVRHQEMGLTRMQAALKGSKQISFTILSMTLSLVAVFLPLLFMKDVTGMLFREFSVTLAVSILVSGFISLSLTPMLCSKFSSTHEKKSSLIGTRILGFYDRSLNWCLNHRKTTLGFAGLCITATVFLFRALSINLFPEEDRGFIWSYLQIPSGLSQKDLAVFQDNLNEILQSHSAIDSYASLNFKDYQIYFIRLVPANMRAPQAAVVSELQTKLSAVPDVSPFMKGIQLISADGGGIGFARSNYQYILRGSDFNEVRRAAEDLKQRLYSHPEIVNPSLDIRADDPKLEITVFEEQAEKLGLSRQRIQSLLQTAYSGASIGTIDKNAENYKVFLELDPAFQRNSDALAKLFLKTSNGTAIPLKAVAHWKESVGMQTINHIDLLPSAVLFFDIGKEVSPQVAMEIVKNAAAETLPPSVIGKLVGMADMVDSTANDTLLLLLLAVVAMYVVLGILYESFIHPITILSSLPFACLGGILTLLAFKEPLSLYSMVGLLLLIGIVKKNGIMMIDYALEIQRKEARPSLEAVKEACIVRFRPIMMTTIAAIMGAIPIAIGIGAGSETRRGLGLVIAGGLIFSQFLTLYITPILYFYLEKLSRKKLVPV